MCAFLRTEGLDCVLVAGCIRPVRLTQGRPDLPVGACWGDTRLMLPELAVGTTLRNVFTAEELRVTEHEATACVPAREALAVLPFGLWLAVKPHG